MGLQQQHYRGTGKKCALSGPSPGPTHRIRHSGSGAHDLCSHQPSSRCRCCSSLRTTGLDCFIMTFFLPFHRLPTVAERRTVEENTQNSNQNIKIQLRSLQTCEVVADRPFPCISFGVPVRESCADVEACLFVQVPPLLCAS